MSDDDGPFGGIYYGDSRKDRWTLRLWALLWLAGGVILFALVAVTFWVVASR